MTKELLDDGFSEIASGQGQRRIRRHHVATVLIALGLLIAAGFVAMLVNRDISAVPTEGESTWNPNVTRANYLKIEPEMTSAEVAHLLGKGELVDEEGLIVGSDGSYRKYSRAGDRVRGESGSVERHDGTETQIIRRRIRWRSGEAEILVTFENDRVTDKTEQGLF